MLSFAIVIPCKNESENIGLLLGDISRQTIFARRNGQIIVADAESTDDTKVVAKESAKNLPLIFCKGGLPGIGRNNGAKRTNASFIFFLDADIRIHDEALLERAMDIAIVEKRDCVGCCIGPLGDTTLLEHIWYKCYSGLMHLSRIYRPFAPGAFQLWRRSAFDKIGGFDESLPFASDWRLTQLLRRRQFTIVPGIVRTGNRRFRQMGFWRYSWLGIRTVLFHGRAGHFKKDHGYWDHHK